jgi:hypothetical protein
MIINAIAAGSRQGKHETLIQSNAASRIVRGVLVPRHHTYGKLPSSTALNGFRFCIVAHRCTRTVDKGGLESKCVSNQETPLVDSPDAPSDDGLGG